MKFEFAKYTDVTTVAKKMDKEFYGQYEKVLICPDVKSVWVAKILKGYDEDYNVSEDSILIERNKIDEYSAKHSKVLKADLFGSRVLQADIDDDCNWDVEPYDDIEDALDKLSDGFGIIEEGE